MTRALVVVDMQNDFVDPRGSLHVRDAQSLVPLINSLAGRHVYEAIVLTRCSHRKDDPSFAASGGPWPSHCVQGTWGAWFHPELEPVSCRADLVIGKAGYSAFSEEGHRNTGLHGYLRDIWVDELHVCGVARDFCVRTTCTDAARLGYRTTMLWSLTRAVSPDNDTLVLDELRKEGVEVSP